MNEMMMNRICMVFIPILMLLGCGTSTPTFYTLSAMGSGPTGGGLGIGVGPVILAEYLNRQNLMVKTSENQIEASANHLWAGDLRHSVSRVISVNLGSELNTGNVRSYPWRGDGEIDYQVTMDIHEFVAANDGYAHLHASWRVFAMPERRLVSSETFVAREPVKETTFEAMIAAQSRLLARFSNVIADCIRKHQ
ncbi:MAG: hypothetical protein RL346_1096 [Verrucomicrobiota bacterium]